MVLLPGPLLPADAVQREAMLALQLERPIYQNIKNNLNVPLLQDLLSHVAAQPDGLALQRWQVSTETEAHLHRQVGWLIKAGLVTL
jgi:hypothetical protein